ncbi:MULTISPECIES: BtrH N-terminal domain-containing protein [unclassified Streptomyces]|uniref:BtrH N-terminal domain-containing protein n=1 Tax=unclassified Streptomyces TaxID=2593676 RepID=UPI0028C439F2|nr:MULTISPECIES: BtrH N-terminal domain-containing protein [unclassified Streptomyces]WNO72659.1 BtrH N-terminal domain-containing protein [Streptomyces sp. AM8-1-1]
MNWKSGEHCESSTLANMLLNRGIDLSEPLLFGLGRGISFLYWHSKQMPAPFLGGRVKPDHLIRNATAALGVELFESETTSQAKAERELIAALDAGEVVGLKLDRFHLDYAHDSFHFAAHYLACVGYTPETYTVVETAGLGVQSTSRAGLAQARAAKGPMSSRSLSFRLGTSDFDPRALAGACREAIAATADDFLNPPITNMGHKGFQKAAKAMRGWCDALDEPAAAFGFLAHSIEDGGTGGGFFRTLWADFLDEAAELTGEPAYASVAGTYRELSTRWTRIAHLLRDESEPAAMRKAAEEVAVILEDLGRAEHDAMSKLAVMP